MSQPKSLDFSLGQRPLACGFRDCIKVLAALVCRTRQTCSLPPHQRPRPGRRRIWKYYATSSQWLLCTLIVLSMLSVNAQASGRDTRRKRHGSFLRLGDAMWPIDTVRSPDGVPREIVFDSSPAPGSELRLRRRQGGDLFEPTKPGPKAAAASTSADRRPTFTGAATAVPSTEGSEGSAVISAPRSRTSTASSTSAPQSSSSSPSETGIVMAPGTSTGDLPKVFDGGLGNNYTEPSCPTFLQSMIDNQTFTDCLPFSLLLQVLPLNWSFTLTPDRNANLEITRTPSPFSLPPNPIAPFPTL